MNLLHHIFATLLIVGFVFGIGCWLAKLMQPKAWTLHNRTTLGRFADRWIP